MIRVGIPENVYPSPGLGPRATVRCKFECIGSRLRVGDVLEGVGKLRAALPALSGKVLSDRLAQLTRTGVVARHRHPAWPPRVHYTLTPTGHRLGPVLQALWDWGTQTPLPADGTPPTQQGRTAGAVKS
ncbi:helix-turn-helix domain-containing protein [Streptomyces sp. NPDC021969]|uniref:winged helix-turn-helix transcriptional regulator n=1 Tax=unclassified Streptomyces TaxID=2593676 RepID=UPI0033F283F6